MSGFSFLDITVHALTIDALHVLIKEAVEKNDKYIISHHNLHSLYIYHHEQKMREFYNQSTYIHIDGMPLVFLGRLFGYPLQRRHRVTYADWIRPLMHESARQGWRVFFLGSKPWVANEAKKVLVGEIPELQMKTMPGYFNVALDSHENQQVIEKIKEYGPDLLMVGMGMPRQEYWVLDNLININASVILTVGGCMDYVAKAVPTPPRWLGKMGFEWLYRMFSEPKRLWRRYLLEPWYILKLLVRQII